jgi:hypothetical protein
MPPGKVVGNESTEVTREQMIDEAVRGGVGNAARPWRIIVNLEYAAKIYREPICAEFRRIEERERVTYPILVPGGGFILG